MKNKTRFPSRRHFLKGAAINAAVLSTIPVKAFEGAAELPFSSRYEGPKMPLHIMMKWGWDEDLKNKLTKLSPEIKLSDKESAVEDVNAWFGPINQSEFNKAVNLRWVQSSSAGVEHYLFPEMVQSEVLLTNAKGCYAPAIAEHTIGLLFTLTRKIGSQTRNMVNGRWAGENNMMEMKGMTMGIVGLGGIGSQVARRARAMDMEVIAVDIVPKYREQLGDICDEIRLVQDGGLEWLLSNSDVVVSAAPHTKVSEGMFGAEQFQIMKEGAFFINVSRGKLVKTPALVDALKSGHLAGAGLDVTDPEPLPADHALWTFPNVIITSHISGRSPYSGERLMHVFTENVKRYTRGLPMLNEVDKLRGF
jgi:D-2-hydroxyacid dehydrogenase (NADP+)